ncbi:MAG: TPR end-of-group domain-containing protein [Planctomycetota bacterium]
MRPRAAALSFAASLLAGAGIPAAGENPALGEAVALLGSRDAFDRERGEAMLLRLGPEALPELRRLAESPGDRLLRLRLERAFQEILDAALADYERERGMLEAEKRQAAELRDRLEAARLRDSLRPRIDAWKKKDLRAQEKLEDLLRLERWEALERSAPPGRAGNPPEDLEALRKLRDEAREAVPDLEKMLEDLRRLAALDASGSGPSSELEALRLREIEESVAAREPRVAERARRLEELGLAAWNGLLARAALRGSAGGEDARIEAAANARRGELFPEDPERFEAVRCLRSSLWAWLVDRGSPLEPGASAALERHLARTLEELRDPEPLARRRAEVELYLLGDRGMRALAGEVGRSGGGTPPADAFLLYLLRWRIHPRTYERTGVDFREYPSLGFRERRRRLFEFARTAGEDAVPTLRRIVSDPELESSFPVRLAAAKALAGLKDMSGYELLLSERPDLTLSRPEVSLELGIVQGVRCIRDKQYQAAVEELKRVLAESPFDFRAHYHLAFAYLLLKDYAKAIHHFEIAKRIQPDDQLTLYNLACAYALSGRKDEALRELEAAVSAGFDDVAHIESDPDLDSLREDPRYRDLVGKLRKRR